MYWTHACFAGARSGWRKKGMFELMDKYCQASIMYACVETNSRLLSFSFNVQVIIYVVHMSHYLKEPRRHLPKKKKSIIDTQPHSQPQLQQMDHCIERSHFVQNILLFQGEKGRWLFACFSGWLVAVLVLEF